MAVNKRPEINNIPYEEFQDNETLEKLVQELNENGVGVMVGQLDKLIDWGRRIHCGLSPLQLVAAALSLWLWLLRATTWRVSVLKSRVTVRVKPT